ncbi:MAG TPA: hypothetical protein VLS89_02315 [Candidatus Nanopelagicales bacterium]|nr:hypothetical protein [Candidatus Nanopelagicales bacterium]
MTHAHPIALTLAALLLSGCSAQLGSGAGFGGALDRAPIHFTHSNHIAATTIIRPFPGRPGGALLGAELESRHEAHLGTRWTTGLQLGYGELPDQVPGSTAFELRADIGAVIGDGALFPDGAWYAGGTAAYVIWLWPRRELLDVNNDQWPVSNGLELVIYGRERIYFDQPGGGAGVAPRYDTGLGLALRMRLLSDLL